MVEAELGVDDIDRLGIASGQKRAAHINVGVILVLGVGVSGTLVGGAARWSHRQGGRPVGSHVIFQVYFDKSARETSLRLPGLKVSFTCFTPESHTGMTETLMGGLPVG